MLEGTARILSENYGVQVVFSPDGECKTSRERMTLPYDEAIDECLIMGLMGHETGHLKDTDFNVAKTISKMRTVGNRELLFNICNCLEDIRIERIMETLYPGFLSMFKRMVPYIEERKVPLIELELFEKDLERQGKSNEDIKKIKKKKIDKDIAALKIEMLKEYSEKLVAQLIESERKRRENCVVPEIQKVIDIIYLSLRDYKYDFYPEGSRAFAEDYLLETAAKVLKCRSTADTLKVAEEIYEILTNEKGSQDSLDQQRQEMIQKCGKGQGNDRGQGSGPGGELTDEEIEQQKEREKKAKEERQKAREQGADVEDFVKNKNPECGSCGTSLSSSDRESGKCPGCGKDLTAEEKSDGADGAGSSGGDSDGSIPTKFKVGQKVGSLDHDRKGVVTSVTVENGAEKAEISWS